jgi:rhomboid protease GluP
MLFGSGSFGDPDTLVAWGGNFGPRTTNGEWGRLLVSMFVHAGFLHLVLTMAGLVQAGLIVERLVGYVTFSAVYLMAGLFSSVVSLWLHPMEVGVGASGAVFGIYGFLVAASIWGLHRSSGVTIPLQTVKTLAPSVGLFLLYNVLSGALQFEAELAGFAAGFVSGLVLTQDIAERKPAPRRVMGAVAATFAVAAGLAIPLHGLTDIRPEIEWIVRLEDGTAAQYELAVERFRRGVISSRELARVIEQNIVPELQSARGRLTALGKVPPEHQPLLTRAEEFLRFRDECWRLRAEALEEGNMAILREADRVEMTSLETLEQLKPAVVRQ